MGEEGEGGEGGGMFMHGCIDINERNLGNRVEFHLVGVSSAGLAAICAPLFSRRIQSVEQMLSTSFRPSMFNHAAYA